MINWQYIKGLNEDTSAETEKKSLYTFIDFQYQNNTTLLDSSNLPHIFINTENEKGTNDAGYIIAQKAANQEINETFLFKQQLWIGTKELERVTATQNKGIFLTTDQAILMRKPQDTSNAIRNYQKILFLNGTETNQLVLGNTNINSGYGVYIPCGLEINKNIKTKTEINIGTYLNVGNAIPSGETPPNGSIYASNKIQGLYFNSTSDRRAKDNLKIMNFKALDLINHTNLYSFRYKDTDTLSIGIIAQDIKDVNIDGFKLVDNENATGENMDYMSIHESKLVYVLWKAIQEQQKEIEELKKRLQ